MQSRGAFQSLAHPADIGLPRPLAASATQAKRIWEHVDQILGPVDALQAQIYALTPRDQRPKDWQGHFFWTAIGQFDEADVADYGLRGRAVALRAPTKIAMRCWGVACALGRHQAVGETAGNRTSGPEQNRSAKSHAAEWIAG